MIDAVYAQAAAPAAPSASEQMLHMVVILAITVGIFYFMIIRPQQRRQKETEAMLASIKKGDRVLTTGGIFGTVVGTKDDVVVL
ncbi:MAG TPA: preprotein translocase subunit YajC, partial [Candidatus Eisenbacteria bacterium]